MVQPIKNEFSKFFKSLTYTYLPQDPAIQLLNICLREMKAQVLTETFPMKFYGSFICHSKSWEGKTNVYQLLSG